VVVKIVVVSRAIATKEESREEEQQLEIEQSIKFTKRMRKRTTRESDGPS